MQKWCPYYQHFLDGLIYTSKWGSFNILWSSAALLLDESPRYAPPSHLEDILFVRAIFKPHTSSSPSGRWKGNLEFPERACIALLQPKAEGTMHQKSPKAEDSVAKSLSNLNNVISNTAAHLLMILTSQWPEFWQEENGHLLSVGALGKQVPCFFFSAR